MADEAIMVAVCGCTGRQGGAVAEALLARGMRVRGLTRRPDSAAAEALEDAGVQLVRADFDRPDTLVPAFTGCAAAYLMTDHFAHLDPGREVRQADALFAACAAAGVRHVVWSSGDDTRPLATSVLSCPGSDLPVPHMDAKAIAAEHLAASGLPHTILIPSGFMEMFLGDMAPQPKMPGPLCRLLNAWRAPERPPLGAWALVCNVEPATRMPWIACEDIGHLAAAIIQQGPAEWGGRTLVAATDVVTMPEVAAILSEATGGAIGAMCVSDALMRRLMVLLGGVPSKAAWEVANMMAYIRRFNGQMAGARQVDACRELCPGGGLTLRAWAEDHRDQLRRVMRQGGGSNFMKGRKVG